MSPGIQWITQMDLPFVVIGHPDYRCPKCGRQIVIKAITEWAQDGRVTETGLVIGCQGEPIVGSNGWAAWSNRHYTDADWQPVLKRVHEWFGRFYRFRFLSAETIAKKRLKKWRRMA